jgi:hypothetical protein
MRERSDAYNFSAMNLNEGVHLEEVDVDCRMILK